MNKNLHQKFDTSLFDHPKAYKKLKFNYKKNKEQDNTELLDQCAQDFNYEACKNEYWNPESFSLLYGTPIWNQASESQRIILNQLYWVGYYSQIISAEIATIFLNQTSAAGLYSLEDFRIVCETLDFESMQERAHIDAFKIISEQVEEKLFGKRIFTSPMKPFFLETMIFQNTNRLKEMWKRFQFHFLTVLSSSNAFIASQYLTVRGLRTLNGKIVQHKLSQFYKNHHDQENAPIPSKVSFHHFMDESYHFNSSNIIGSDIIEVLAKPTRFEKIICNQMIKSSLVDHFNFTCTINGIFWFEPSTFKSIYKVLRSKSFAMSEKEAINMMEQSFCKDNDGIQESFQTQKVALESYKNYLQNIDYVSAENKLGGKMRFMDTATHLSANQKHFSKFKSQMAFTE